MSNATTRSTKLFSEKKMLSPTMIRKRLKEQEVEECLDRERNEHQSDGAPIQTHNRQSQCWCGRIHAIS